MKKLLLTLVVIIVFVLGFGAGLLFQNTDLYKSEDIESFVSSFCNPSEFKADITQGRFFGGSADMDQYFVHCETPLSIPVPTLYLIQHQPPNWGGFVINWSLKHSDRAREVGKPEIVDVNGDGFSDIYWTGATWGGTCAPWSASGFVYSGKHHREYSIERKYEFNEECTETNVYIETVLSPDPSSFDPQVVQPFYDFLEDRIPLVR